MPFPAVVNPLMLRRPDTSRFYVSKAYVPYEESGALTLCKPFPPFEIPRSPNWSENPHRNATWRLYYNSLTWLLAIDFGADTETGEALKRQYRDRIRVLVLDYLGHLMSPKCEDDMWDDHAAGWRASMIGYFYLKYLRDSLGEADRDLVFAAVREHEKRLTGFLHSPRWKSSNHSLFHAEGLFDLTAAFPDVTNAEASRALAVRAVRDLFEDMISVEDGVAREHSLFYHLYDATLLMETDSYFERFGVKIFDDIETLLARMLEFHVLCSPLPRMPAPAVGDTLFGWSDRYTPGMLRKHIEATGTVEYFETQKESGTQPPLLSCYPETGFYAVYNERPGGDHTALFLEKQKIGPHGHFDGNSFTISAGGEQFLIDSGGPYSYSNRFRHEYFCAAEAHNVLILGGVSRKYHTKVVATGSDPTGAYVQGVADLAEGVRWTRWFVALKSGNYLAIDAVSSETQRRFDYLYHWSDHLDIEKMGPQRYLARGKKRQCSVQLIAGTELEITQSRGGEEFPRSFTTGGHEQKAPSKLLRVGTNAASHWCVTLLSFDKSKLEQAQVLDGGAGLRVQLRGAVETLVQVDLTGKNAGAAILPLLVFRMPAVPEKRKDAGS
jgi:hypothetical protein